MENKDFRVSINLVLVLAIGSLLFIVLGAWAKLYHLEFAHWLLLLGSFSSFATWIVVISDMVRSKIYNKTFWITSMFIFTPVAVIVYLIQRDRLLKWGQSEK